MLNDTIQGADTDHVKDVISQDQIVINSHKIWKYNKKIGEIINNHIVSNGTESAPFEGGNP